MISVMELNMDTRANGLQNLPINNIKKKMEQSRNETKLKKILS